MHHHESGTTSTDPATRTITAGELRLTLTAGAQRAVWTTPWLESPASDWWTMSIQHGEIRDTAARSSNQTGQASPSREGGLRIHYDRIVTDDGTVLAIDYTVSVETDDDSLRFSGELELQEPGRVVEVTLPVVTLPPADDQVLYEPLGLGRRVVNPAATLARGHTEYMAGDHRAIQNTFAYPGEYSMGFLLLEQAEGTLYLGRHDPEFRACLFSTDLPPRQHPPLLSLSTTAVLWANGHRRVTTGPTVVAVAPRTTWHDAAQRYRAWADTWYKGPYSDAAAGVAGWQRLIMRHQYGEVLLRYSDLVDAFEAGRTAGLTMILLFGWWRGGFDRLYPSYEPDPELGGAEELAAAIREIESRGGIVALYANGNLIDRKGSFYEIDDHHSTRKDLNGLEYVVGYNFSSESRSLRHFSGPDFAMGCHGAEPWRVAMADVARQQLGLGTSWVFFDQLGYHLVAWPCTDTTHDHGDRVDEEATHRRRTLADIRAQGAGLSLGSEGMADCMIGHLDYHHGWGFAYQDEAEAFPSLFRETFPEPVVSNRLVHDQRAGWLHQLHFAFVHNLIYDVAIYRCRALVTELPEYAREIARLTSLRESYTDYFRSGAYHLVEHTEGLVRVEYRLPESSMDVTWSFDWRPGAETSDGEALEVTERQRRG